MSGISQDEAISLLNCQGVEIYALLARAHQRRLDHSGTVVRLCGIINAKSGKCTEDCKFCAQSAHNDAEIDCYNLVDPEAMVARAQASQENHAARFGIVTSGLAVTEQRDIQTISAAIERIAAEQTTLPCASLGNIDRDTLARLKQAGLTRYHCNVECAQSFFSKICTTHAWEDSINTIRAAKSVGLATCSGGIFGLGESLSQRVELLDQIRAVNVDSVPLNFYHPVPGTPLEEVTPISPLDCLKIVAVARLMMPKKEIRVCGGREHNLRDLQSWALTSGADGLMVGGYLTTAGRSVADDLQMISDAGFTVEHSH